MVSCSSLDTPSAASQAESSMRLESNELLSCSSRLGKRVVRISSNVFSKFCRCRAGSERGWGTS